jgi:1,4-dihydroxy-2-naphthoyl-CoA hydrolase
MNNKQQGDNSSAIHYLNDKCRNTLVSTLGIEFTQWDNNTLEATMPVDQRTIQPWQILHGGAMLALAETLGSAASALLVDMDKYTVLGLSISSNHIKAVKQGTVRGVAKIIHKGRSTHIWDIGIYDEDNNLASTSRFTNMIVEKQQ